MRFKKRLLDNSPPAQIPESKLPGPGKRLAGTGFIAAGVLLLLLPFLRSFGYGSRQRQLQTEWQAARRQEKMVPPAPPRPAPPQSPPPRWTWPARLRIHSVALDLIVLDGVDEATLAKAPGHYPGSSLPGEAGNCLIIGHHFMNNASFRMLTWVSKGDMIQIESPPLRYNYKVIETRILNPEIVKTLPPAKGASLLLITCAGLRSEKRIVVQATLLSAAPRKNPAALKGSGFPDSAFIFNVLHR